MARLTWPRARYSSTLKKPLTCLFDPVFHRRRRHDLDLSEESPIFSRHQH